MSESKEETSSLLGYLQTKGPDNEDVKRSLHRNYQTLASHDENQLPSLAFMGINNNYSNNDNDVLQHKDIVYDRIVRLNIAAVCTIWSWVISIITAILASYYKFYNNKDYHQDNNSSLIFYLRVSVMISLLQTFYCLFHVCISLKRICSVTIIPEQRMEYMKSRGEVIPLEFVTLARLPIIRTLVFVFISLIYIMSMVLISLVLMFEWYSGAINHLWLVLLPAYLCCFTCLAYMTLVKDFKFLQVFVFILGIIDSFLMINKIKYVCGLSWFLVSTPLIIIEAILAFGVCHFLYHAWKQKLDANQNTRSAWFTVLLTSLLIITSICAEVMVIKKEFMVTNSLFSCATADLSSSSSDLNHHIGKHFIGLDAFHNPVYFVVLSILITATLLSYLIIIHFDALLKSNGNTIPRVLFRTWSGWNLQDVVENPVFSDQP